MTAYTWTDDDERDLDTAYQYQGETDAQHRNETAQFGDSWPGAQQQLQTVALAIHELRHRQRHAHWRHVAWTHACRVELAAQPRDRMPF